jgi:hypothetical protein
LREISGRFHEVSDSLKYAFLEETMCFLSVLDPGDTAQTSHASEVVNTLSQYSISDYKGTTASEKNFQENLEALHHYRPTSHESIEPEDVPAPEERKFSKARRGPKTGPLSPPPDASDDESEGFISASGLNSEILKTALQKRLAETGGPLEGFDQSLLLKYAMRMMTNEEASNDITRELAEDTLNRPDDDPLAAGISSWLSQMGTLKETQEASPQPEQTKRAASSSFQSLFVVSMSPAVAATDPYLPTPPADGQTRASTRKRGLDGNDSPSAGGGNGGDGEPNKRRKIKEPSDRSNHKYACPFFKRDPEKYKNYRSCPGPGWETVHRLK